MKQEIIDCFTWLANRVSETTTYENWSDAFCRKDIKKAMSVFLDELSKYIDWDNLTDDDCDMLRFGYWQDKADVEEEISALTKELKDGKLTLQEYEKKVEEQRNTLGIRLIPLYLLPILPVGTKLVGIFGKEVVYDGKNIDTDIRMGRLAYGIKINK
ncbi:MAG: hypothetical protein KBT34_07250 [Prevotella sp.]|nr:hypothetical protein [Candidatus Prevotella equi]